MSASSCAVAAVEFVLLGGEFGLDRGLLLAQAETSPIIESIALFCSAIVAASALWSLAHVAELALRVLELFFQVLCRRRSDHAEEGQEQRRGQQQPQ